MTKDEIKTMTPKTFGQKIKKKRVELGMTLDDLAKLTGYNSANGVARVENGHVGTLPLSKAKAFSDALGIPIEEFF